MKFQTSVEIDPYEIAMELVKDHNGEKRLLTFIKDIDLSIADVGFTEELIKILATSLKADKEDVDLPFINWENV